jgi:hypothetical protein
MKDIINYTFHADKNASGSYTATLRSIRKDGQVVWRSTREFIDPREAIRAAMAEFIARRPG